MNDQRQEWVELIAQKSKSSVGRVTQLLEHFSINPEPICGEPLRLFIKQITFSGVKSGTDGWDGEISFDWSNLTTGLWAISSDGNFKGKSSIIEIVKWLLRGDCPSGLQEDVKEWIHQASLLFSLDETPYKVSFSKEKEFLGSLLKLRGDSLPPAVIANFNSEQAFKQTMSSFFLKKLGMESISTVQSAEEKNELESLVQHGWAALSGVMFMGTNYSSMISDLPVRAGLQSRLMQMYLGIPWASTLNSANNAKKILDSRQNENTKDTSVNKKQETKRITELKKNLTSIEGQLEKLSTVSILRAELKTLNSRYIELKQEEKKYYDYISKEEKTLATLKELLIEDKRALQRLLDSIAAGNIFKLIEPSICPCCESKTGILKRKNSTSESNCALCGETIKSYSDDDSLKEKFKENIKLHKTAIARTNENIEQARQQLDKLLEEEKLLDSNLSEVTNSISNDTQRNELEKEIYIIKGRIEELSYDHSDKNQNLQEDISIINRVVTETKKLTEVLQEKLLPEVSDKIVHFANEFGMTNLSEANLKTNQLSLRKGNVDTSYSKLTNGEKLRIKVAILLAMIHVAEKEGIGRYPGLLMIDSPKAQEVAPKDFEALISGLVKIVNEVPHMQIFIAATNSDAIRDNISAERSVVASGDNPLW